MVRWLLKRPRKKVCTTLSSTRSWEFKCLPPGPAVSSSSLRKLHPQNATDLQETDRNEDSVQQAKPNRECTDGLKKVYYQAAKILQQQENENIMFNHLSS